MIAIAQEAKRPPVLGGGLPFLGHAIEFHRDPTALLQRGRDQFGEIFRSSCRQPATEDELAILDGYTVNVLLSGPGGSMAAARSMMQAGAAIVKIFPSRSVGSGYIIDLCISC